MKKWGLIFIVGCMMLLAACGGGNNNNQSSPSPSGSESGGASSGAALNETITWWVPNWDEAVAKELAAKFEAENAGVKVKLVITTWDTMENQIRVALMTKDAPDLITELESRVKTYAKQNLLRKVDDYYDDTMPKDDFIASALDINTHDGGLYGVPFRHDGAGILYNKNMFKDAGLDPDKFPATWAEFVEAAAKLTKDTNGDGQIDQYATAWPLGNQANAVSRYMLMLFSEGGNVFNEDESASLLNSPEAVEALRKLTDTVKTGAAPKSTVELDNTSMRDLFINEKIAMYIGGQFDIEPIQSGKPSIDLGTAVIPGKDGMATTTVDGFSLIVPESAASTEGVRKLVQFIAQPENMANLTATFPGRKSALQQPKFADPLLKPFSDQLEKGQTVPKHDKWSQIEKAIYRYIQLVVLNNMDVQEAADKMKAEVDAAMK